MSEVKAPKKSDAGAKTSEAKKTEVKKPEAEQSATATETSSTDKATGKADAAPKSASQSSISHFSSVSTPAYRSGWKIIFDTEEVSNKTKSKSSNGDNFPDHLSIEDENIDTELRNVLYKLFQRKARRQGLSLYKIKKISSIEYKLYCYITKD